MKIDGPGNSGGAPGLTRPANARPTASGSHAGDSEKVNLSPASAALASAGREPGVDTARVQEIRQAIAEGRFQINPGAIADRLIATARELVDAQRKA